MNRKKSKVCLVNLVNLYTNTKCLMTKRNVNKKDTPVNPQKIKDTIWISISKLSKPLDQKIKETYLKLDKHKRTPYRLRNCHSLSSDRPLDLFKVLCSCWCG
jgi:hypothetical protein